MSTPYTYILNIVPSTYLVYLIPIYYYIGRYGNALEIKRVKRIPNGHRSATETQNKKTIMFE